MKKAIAYYRVSTDQQGKSGLGLDAQKESVHHFAMQQNYQILAEYSEIESGKKNHRPALQEALAAAKKNRAILIIAKLDRLGRNVAFISSLMDSRVDFVAVDNPHANRLMLHMLAAFAEHEREMISTRTKDALQAAKRNGVVLGKHGKEIESKKNAQAAIDFAESMRPVIEQLKAEGFKTQRAIQDELNSRGIPTFRNNGQKWHQYTVHKILKRLNF